MEKPIFFSTSMVRAILDNQKSQTRRIIKLKKEIQNPQFGFTTFTPKGSVSVRGIHKNGEYGESFIKMPYQKGDRLWVRETFWLNGSGMPRFKADFANPKEYGWKWKPSIFLKKEHARIWLEVTDIWVERLQDITEEDARSEGVYKFKDCEGYSKYALKKGKVHLFSVATARESYQTLWESINGKGSWALNPWIWVIEFKRIK
jgi:hypothetical protein